MEGGGYFRLVMDFFWYLGSYRCKSLRGSWLNIGLDIGVCIFKKEVWILV